MDTAYVAAINDYLTRELKVDFTRPYKVLTGEPGSQWNWSMNEQGWPAYVNVTPWLGKGMRENPDLKVLLASGWYDLATPFFGAEIGDTVWGAETVDGSEVIHNGDGIVVEGARMNTALVRKSA